MQMCANILSDENRARVVSQGAMSSIIALLKESSLIPFVIPVLFNICVDFGMWFSAIFVHRTDSWQSVRSKKHPKLS